jgi:hypothetical protein
LSGRSDIVHAITDNEDVATIDAQIDELFQLPPGEFTAARNALAKTLSGDAAREVKQLKKPTVVPWAINQLYWRSRPHYDRLIKAGQALRAAQIAALKGKAADVRRASDAHRKAVADAAARATEITEADGSRPAAEPLARMLEALSLAAEEPEHPGRFTEIVQPAGFEALTGIKPVPPKRAEGGIVPKRQESAKTPKEDAKARAREEARLREMEAQVRAAEQQLERARAVEAKARAAHDRAREEVRAAEQTLAAARLGGAR